MSLSKKIKITLGVLIALLIVGFVSYKYIMKPPTLLKDRDISFEGSSQEIFQKVQEKPMEWQDKVVLITGTITSKDDKGFTLSKNIYCQLADKQNIDINKDIKVKGRIIGYDDLLEELKLDQCLILNKK